jgi:hypothetical protein
VKLLLRKEQAMTRGQRRCAPAIFHDAKRVVRICVVATVTAPRMASECRDVRPLQSQPVPIRSQTFCEQRLVSRNVMKLRLFVTVPRRTHSSLPRFFDLLSLRKPGNGAEPGNRVFIPAAAGIYVLATRLRTLRWHLPRRSHPVTSLTASR